MCCEIKYHHKLLYLANDASLQWMHEVSDGLPQSG